MEVTTAKTPRNFTVCWNLKMSSSVEASSTSIPSGTHWVLVPMVTSEKFYL